jgi:hypothetical protein
MDGTFHDTRVEPPEPGFHRASKSTCIAWPPFMASAYTYVFCNFFILNSTTDNL